MEAGQIMGIPLLRYWGPHLCGYFRSIKEELPDVKKKKKALTTISFQKFKYAIDVPLHTDFPCLITSLFLKHYLLNGYPSHAGAGHLHVCSETHPAHDQALDPNSAKHFIECIGPLQFKVLQILEYLAEQRWQLSRQHMHHCTLRMRSYKHVGKQVQVSL